MTNDREVKEAEKADQLLNKLVTDYEEWILDEQPTSSGGKIYYLAKALQDVRELHEEQDDFFGGSYCKLCSREELFPCPTIQAIDEALKELL